MHTGIVIDEKDLLKLDKKMDNTDLMFEDYWWSKVALHGIDKGYKTPFITYLCSKENRTNVMRRIVSGKFDFGIPRIAKIPKDNGGFREVYVLGEEERLVGYIVSEIYNWKYSHLISKYCESYQKGKSTSRTVRELKDSIKSGVKVDISKYFDNVSIETINKNLDKIDSKSPIDYYVRKFYNTNLISINGEIVERYKGICQGSPLSAFLSNIILRDIDDKISKMCVEYRRYSDDIIALGGDTGKILSVLEEELSKLGLSLNPNKIEILTPDKEFKFLGYGLLGDDIIIAKETMKKKKAEIKKICKKYKSLKSRINAINRMFYLGKTPMLNWAYPKFHTITNIDRLDELDNYCKDCLRNSVTGKWNYVHNKNKVPDSMLRDNGYVSLKHMYNMSKCGKAVWCQTVDNVLKGFPVQ